MARCRCTEEHCACTVMAGPGITVSGAGSSASPYLISLTDPNFLLAQIAALAARVEALENGP